MADFIDDRLVYRSIGRKIKECRENAVINHEKVTQEILAKALGLTRASIANYEAGSQSVSIFDLYRIADLFGVSVTGFLPSVDSVKISGPELNLQNREDLTDDERDAIKLIISTMGEGDKNEG